MIVRVKLVTTRVQNARVKLNGGSLNKCIRSWSEPIYAAIVAEIENFSRNAFIGFSKSH